jgi:phosphoketolase
LDWAGYQREQARIILVAVGAYQLMEVLAASRRLAEQEVPHAVVCLLEPGRFRTPRSVAEQAHVAAPDVVARLFPAEIAPRLFVTHTRPETMLGLLGPLHTGADTAGLGYINHGGTLSTPGMLFVNRSSWAHCVREAARLLHLSDGEVLSLDERQALDGRRSPHGVIVPETVV